MRTRLVGSWTHSDVPSEANQRGATGSPTWIRVIRGSAGSDADGGGAAVVDGDDDGEATTSAELVADTAAEAGGVTSRIDGLADAAQASTDIAMTRATPARMTTDACDMSDSFP
jgi:hypothetical protein